eukprot:COSAG01_NODE_38966_length_482_cov_190.532637_1_plen_77_part_10
MQSSRWAGKRGSQRDPRFGIPGIPEFLQWNPLQNSSIDPATGTPPSQNTAHFSSWTLAELFVLTRWTLRGSEPGFGF